MSDPPTPPLLGAWLGFLVCAVVTTIVVGVVLLFTPVAVNNAGTLLAIATACGGVFGALLGYRFPAASRRLAGIIFFFIP